MPLGSLLTTALKTGHILKCKTFLNLPDTELTKENSSYPEEPKSKNGHHELINRTNACKHWGLTNHNAGRTEVV